MSETLFRLLLAQRIKSWFGRDYVVLYDREGYGCVTEVKRRRALAVVHWEPVNQPWAAVLASVELRAAGRLRFEKYFVRWRPLTRRTRALFFTTE